MGWATGSTVTSEAGSDQSGEADFFVPTTDTGLMESASSLNSDFRPDHSESFEVRVVTLDEFVAACGCGPIDLMKMDVKTCEDRVLRGGLRAINESRPYIFLEILMNAGPTPLEAVRDELGYVSAQLRPTGIEWQDRIVASPTDFNHIFYLLPRREEGAV